MGINSRSGKRPLVTAAALASLLAIASAAEAAPPQLSANPANLAIFPARGQTPDQQRADEAASYDWATQQTGWDPYQAKAVLDQQSQAATTAAGAARGGAVKGAAIGATSLGLTGGMRSRRAVQAAGNTSDKAVAAYQQQFGVWTRNYMAAMEAKGYSLR